MNTIATPNQAHTHNAGWFVKTESWLDHKGKGAWVAAMVLGFVFFWPVGLAILAYMIWSKRMFSKSHACAPRSHMRAALKPSGNSAFDAYKSETLRRLEDEQANFQAFLERLRAAKDKSEFDQFMDEQSKTPADEDAKDA
ncbi:MAG: DUF2852 domain-containing protein [Pseudomonadota bacterium]